MVTLSGFCNQNEHRIEKSHLIVLSLICVSYVNKDYPIRQCLLEIQSQFLRGEKRKVYFSA